MAEITPTDCIVSSTYSGYTAAESAGTGLRDGAIAQQSSVWAASGGAGGTITMDLGSPVFVGTIDIRPIASSLGWGTAYLDGAVLDYSDDESNWTTANPDISITTEGTTTVNCNATARYWRLTKTDNYFGLGEFRLYGDLQSVNGSGAVTEVADVLAATGMLPLTGTAPIAEAADALSAMLGRSAIAGTVSLAEADDTSAATGVVSVSGAAAVVVSADTLTAAGGSAAVGGSAAIAEAGDTAVAMARLGVAGVASIAEADETASAAGAISGVGGLVAFTAAVLVTEADDAVAAVLVRVFRIPPARRLRLQRAQRSSRTLRFGASQFGVRSLTL